MTVSCPDCRSVFRVDPAKVPATGVRARCSVCGGIIVVSGGTGALRTPARTPVSAMSTGGLSRTPARSATPRAPGPMVTPSPAAASSRPTPATATPMHPTPVRAVPPSRAMPVQHSISTPLGAVTPRNATPTAVPGVVSFMTPPIPAPVLVVPTRLPTPPVPPTPRAQHQVGVSSTPASVAGPAPVAPSSSASTSASVSAIAAAAPTDLLTPRRPINPFLKADPGQRARRLARALVSDLVAYHPKKRDEGLAQGTLRALFREDIKKSYEEYVDQVGKEIAESTPHFQEALNDILASGQRMF